MHYKVRHITTVDYAGAVRLARFNLRLKPAPWPGQVLEDFRLSIDPVPWSMQEESGPFVVNRSRFVIAEPLTHLTIESTFGMEVSEPSLIAAMYAQADGESEGQGPSVEQVRDRALRHRDLGPMGPANYLYPSPMAPSSSAIAAWASRFFPAGQGVLSAARALMRAIHAEFTYDGSATTSETLPDEAFQARHGVCQDFAHVMIVAARAHGIPAAYVSGYLRTIPPPGQPRLVGADATHAWANLWCGDELGWIGFDPTNDSLVRSDHIFTAMGRDYADVAPVDGVFHGGAGQTMTVSVDVEPQDG
ncbi:transglutaminase-like enzyme [Novosphingobium nitrogenifigens DSM 19370]|uniref:Transglutaminase-like enzyme n=1 Tax=Novosphingobium nitrogenifigens DSM 19370 TaxID=983920 RepID=F1Z5J3_9SPHN|nr:transglutaminase family protein [Novosphingobium nitrogenifigens]EGD60103.1 transglutaminase-like enzyme [Novosphingobium nitrogenifigens DSM 19370]